MVWQKLLLCQRKWPDLSLRAKCLLLISFPAAATVLMFGVANLLAGRNAAAVERVNHALRTGQEIERLRAAEIEASANVRAYFITAQESFIRQGRLSIEAFESSQHKLLDLTADSPLQQQRLTEIVAIEHAREERMFGDIARFRVGNLPWDQLRTAVSQVEAARRQKADLLQAMEQDNSRQLETLLKQAESLRVVQAATTAIFLVFGLLGGLAMTLLFARGITSRIACLQRNVARLAAGVAPDELPGRDEIGILNEGLTRVADVLRRKAWALENALLGIAELDANGRCQWFNKAYADITAGSQIRRASGIVSIVQPEDQPRIQQAIAQMRSDGRAEIDARIDQTCGPASDVRITFLAAADDPGSSFFVFLSDISAAKRGDAALIRAKEAAIASNRAKTEFLAKISHDIRTPLNAILGSVDLLSQTPLSAEQGEYVSMFQRNCRRLVALINDFLDFSRIEAGAVRVESVPFRVRETVEDAVATFRESASRKGIALGIEIDQAVPACVLGDPLRIQQVLVNLLSNALKFTVSGRVDVNLKVVSSAAARHPLRFEVRDTGPGIRLADQDKIFARFVQLPNHGKGQQGSNGQRGTGLGLAICRELVELMGGEIGVASQEGIGSAFYFSLPLEAMEPSDAIPCSRQTGTAELTIDDPIRILVAEDTEDNRLLLEHYLRDEPVKLRFAMNGQEAVDVVERGERFDLILMDIDMPDMDGYTASKRIRAWQQLQMQSKGWHGQATPIVALSADAMRDAVRASKEAGCVAHVAKPVDRETLVKTIRRFAVDKPEQSWQKDRIAAIAEQVKALVPQYLASNEKQIEEARAFLAARDFGSIGRFGHNLKGTGRGYGFPFIEEMGREIEQAAAQADTSRIAAQLDALHQFVSESAAALAKS